MFHLNSKVGNLHRPLVVLVSVLAMIVLSIQLKAESFYHAPSGCNLERHEDLLHYNKGLSCREETSQTKSAQSTSDEQSQKQLTDEERRQQAVKNLEQAYERGRDVLEAGWSKVAPYWSTFSGYLWQAWTFVTDAIEAVGSWVLLEAIPAIVATIAVIFLVLLKLIVIVALLIKSVVLWLFGTVMPSLGHYLIWLLFIMLVVWLSRRSGFVGYSLYRLNRTVLSAEFGILEIYRRWRGSDGGDRKVAKNLSLFEALVAPTIEINRHRSVEMALINMGATPQPVNVFKDEAAEIYASRQAENEKASKRKKAARLSLGLYRLVIFGEPRVAREALDRMSQTDRDLVAPGVVSLVNSPDLTHPVTLNLARWYWRYPATLTARKEDGTVLRGMEAFNFIEMEIAGVD